MIAKSLTFLALLGFGKALQAALETPIFIDAAHSKAIAYIAIAVGLFIELLCMYLLLKKYTSRSRILFTTVMMNIVTLLMSPILYALHSVDYPRGDIGDVIEIMFMVCAGLIADIFIESLVAYYMLRPLETGRIYFAVAAANAARWLFWLVAMYI